MAFRRPSIIPGALAVLVVTGPIATPSFAQEARKLTKDEIAQYTPVRQLVDAVVSGKQPAPSDLNVTFRSDFLKSGSGIYIPYRLHFSPSFQTYPVVLYVRAVHKNVSTATITATTTGRGRGARTSPVEQFAFEDVYFIDAKTVTSLNSKATTTTSTAGNTTTSTTQVTSGPVTATSVPPNLSDLNRAMELPPGDYDIYIALRETPGKDKTSPAPKAVVFQHPLTVPNLLTGLSTSSVILAKDIQPATAQLSGQQQLEEPYTVSGYTITPSPVTSFPKSGELLWVFYIYNEGEAAAGKPDVTVDYNFFRAGEEKPFVNMPSASYNASNLPPEFNLSAGHMVFVALGVPLTTFNPGEYKVQMKITDKTNNQSVTRDVPFTVTP
jgi:hypothetical protein